jgi:hypothetical protein
MELIDETGLHPEICRQLADIRGTNNVRSLTVVKVLDRGVLALLVPTDAVDEGGGWKLPDEPFLVTILVPTH